MALWKRNIFLPLHTHSQNRTQWKVLKKPSKIPRKKYLKLLNLNGFMSISASRYGNPTFQNFSLFFIIICLYILIVLCTLKYLLRKWFNWHTLTKTRWIHRFTYKTIPFTTGSLFSAVGIQCAGQSNANSK